MNPALKFLVFSKFTTSCIMITVTWASVVMVTVMSLLTQLLFISVTMLVCGSFRFIGHSPVSSVGNCNHHLYVDSKCQSVQLQ